MSYSVEPLENAMFQRLEVRSSWGLYADVGGEGGTATEGVVGEGEAAPVRVGQQGDTVSQSEDFCSRFQCGFARNLFTISEQVLRDLLSYVTPLTRKSKAANQFSILVVEVFFC